METDFQPAIADLIQFLKFASVSTDPLFSPQVGECADWLVAKLTRIGLKAERHETKGHPIVVAKNTAKSGRPTVLIYGHYDVQPADPIDLWKTSPFEPRIQGGVLYARGASDDKGQIMAHIIGIQETLEEERELPVNLILLIEGEEEVGSPSLRPFLEAHRDELRCDIVAVSDGTMVSKGRGTLSYGLRGMVAVELTVHGPSTDLHSGLFGGVVANPCEALARILATLHDADGRVAIEGFYSDVRPLQDWEREAWAELPLQDSDWLALTGSPELIGEQGYRPIERCYGRPTAEVNGIGGGYQGSGSKTIIPAKAMAKLTFRLVPDQEPEKIAKLVQDHIARHSPPGVTVQVDVGHLGKPYIVDTESSAALAAKRALRAAFPETAPALVREGGSIPIVQTFKDVLGAETLLLGLALPDSKMHGPNENFPLENFRAGVRINRALLKELAASL